MRNAQARRSCYGRPPGLVRPKASGGRGSTTRPLGRALGDGARSGLSDRLCPAEWLPATGFRASGWKAHHRSLFYRLHVETMSLDISG